ncbi:aminotransferase class I/II-fold pyridoxal phosphate-dependent enzyme [Colidextribacter sp. 210702-DFI.3.9]|uniref:Aminotransferase n=1 Tax=Flintibacter faecis TaxID=2763047 RepID=A0A8J6IXM5_9FIRM|nr:aminotransferase class I/II-fold pyridoxal phosphate-dependent enzyme [Flintibacter faecis]MBC5716695.1 aminotransferase class I/II-fold pyridoxal phosphate-dependent enzyme [Flintibacter faecis]MCB6500522.1 aminotransferase class I/II-fold pyridoxal phosphate-dependent enzyme [Colidextribacter sp. 210702-DFI.3.9]MCG4470720.1 aminotransferase class I/II-fold pyridoxal phosphate-dependent enzyme [Lawsonibacter sp. DFI.6.74]MCG4774970.1 aminotransferase class I/II-fold pyridoxal phosphate-depe
MNYENILNQRIQGVKPSGIRKFFDILEEMTDAISLGIGEPDFVTPWHIRDAGIYSLERGHTKYTSNAGLLQLRREIAAYLNRRFDLQYDYAHQIVVTVGGSEGIDLALRCLLNPGDEVIIPTPSFVCYGPLTEMSGGVPKYLELKVENKFRLTPEELRAAITPNTKVLVLPFPCNPTGGTMDRQDLEAIAQVLEGTDIMVLSDEIYAELTYGQRHVSPANLTSLKDRTVVVNGFSKSHAMTGWRMGYVCGPEPVIQQMLKLHQFGIMSAPTTSQYAAVEAMRNGDPDIEHMREEYDRRRRYLVENLNRIGLSCFEPKGAFYVFPDIRSTGLSSEEFCERFLMEEKVAVIPGSAFGPGGEGFVRACYAASMKDIAESVARLDNFLTNLRRKQGRGEG